MLAALVRARPGLRLSPRPRPARPPGRRRLATVAGGGRRGRRAARPAGARPAAAGRAARGGRPRPAQRAGPAGRIDMAEVPSLSAGVVGVAGRAAGALSLSGARGARATCWPTWRAVFGASAWVLTREEAIDRGWYGPVPAGALGRIGEVVVVCRERAVALAAGWETASAGQLVAYHGAVTAAEMTVPLLRRPAQPAVAGSRSSFRSPVLAVLGSQRFLSLPACGLACLTWDGARRCRGVATRVSGRMPTTRAAPSCTSTWMRSSPRSRCAAGPSCAANRSWSGGLGPARGGQLGELCGPALRGAQRHADGPRPGALPAGRLPGASTARPSRPRPRRSCASSGT